MKRYCKASFSLLLVKLEPHCCCYGSSHLALYDIIQAEKTKRNKSPTQGDDSMWDEMLGIATFILLFVGGLIIFTMYEKWKERKAMERQKRQRNKTDPS